MNRVHAALIVGLAATLGWFWRIGAERDWPVEMFGIAAFVLLVGWLWNWLDRNGGDT